MKKNKPYKVCPDYGAHLDLEYNLDSYYRDSLRAEVEDHLRKEGPCWLRFHKPFKFVRITLRNILFGFKKGDRS
jgi:hypothetical protein